MANVLITMLVFSFLMLFFSPKVGIVFLSGLIVVCTQIIMEEIRALKPEVKDIESKGENIHE